MHHAERDGYYGFRPRRRGNVNSRLAVQNGVTRRTGRSDHSTGTTSIPQNRINISTLANIGASFFCVKPAILVQTRIAMAVPLLVSADAGELPMNRVKL
jgi:hypothetical protein